MPKYVFINEETGFQRIATCDTGMGAGILASVFAKQVDADISYYAIPDSGPGASVARAPTKYPKSVTVPTETLIQHLRWCYDPTLTDTDDVAAAHANISFLRGLLTFIMSYSEREALFAAAREAAKTLPR